MKPNLNRLLVRALFMLQFLVLLTGLSAQKKKSSFNRDTELMLRGKALGFVIIEDWWVRTFSGGLEFKHKQISLVADAVHFRWRYEREVHDLPDSSKYSEYSYYNPRNYLALEFRYYPVFKNISETAYPYLCAISKIGNARNYKQEKYPLSEGEVLNGHSVFYDIGAAIGLRTGDIFGFDFNMGALLRTETFNNEIYHKNDPTTFENNVVRTNWRFNIRVNFYINLSRLGEWAQ